MAFYLCISHGTFLTCLNSIERDQSLLSLSVANVRERHSLSLARACTFYLSKRKAGSSSSTLFRNKLTRFLSMSSMCLSLPPHPSTANPPTDETKHKITPKEREKRRGPHLDYFHQQNCFVFFAFVCVSLSFCVVTWVSFDRSLGRVGTCVCCKSHRTAIILVQCCRYGRSRCGTPYGTAIPTARSIDPTLCFSSSPTHTHKRVHWRAKG